MRKLDQLVTKMAGFEKTYPVVGQTYSRKVDVECLNVLSSLGATIHKVSECRVSRIRLEYSRALILKDFDSCLFDHNLVFIIDCKE